MSNHLYSVARKTSKPNVIVVQKPKTQDSEYSIDQRQQMFGGGYSGAQKLDCTDFDRPRVVGSHCRDSDRKPPLGAIYREERQNQADDRPTTNALYYNDANKNPDTATYSEVQKKPKAVSTYRAAGNIYDEIQKRPTYTENPYSEVDPMPVLDNAYSVVVDKKVVQDDTYSTVEGHGPEDEGLYEDVLELVKPQNAELGTLLVVKDKPSVDEDIYTSFLMADPALRPAKKTSFNIYEDISGTDALLADLQSSIHGRPGSAGGYGALNGGRSPSAASGGRHGAPPSPHSPTYQNQSTVTNEKIVSKSYSSNHGSNSGSLGRAGLKPVGNNLSELDTLLQDLSNARYAGGYGENKVDSVTHQGYGKTNGGVGISPGGPNSRPSVDSLLEQLSSDVPNGTGTQPRPGTKHVTVTVKETVVEPVGHPRSPHPIHTHASNATRELDDLMASLSEFKVSQGTLQHQQTRETVQEVAHRGKEQPAGGDLERMLGSLHADMSRQGVTTAQKGCCGACDKPIVGQVITALGKTWHPEHFTCAHCTQELGTRNFFERDGRPYCEPDYHNLFSPRCAYCNGPILDKCVTALEKTWHMEHFFCAQCGQQFGEDGFHERDGKPYCKNDYFDMFAPKCGGCNRPIMENYISALNGQWHPDCFVCRDCRQPFQGGSFFDHEGLPYCETHYHAKRGSLCAGCHKPIAGRCITAMFRKFHPEHFVCAFCLKQLNKGTFKEQNDKPYCHGCFEKLFG